MDIDLDILEVGIEENEFDDSFNEVEKHERRDDQEMQTAEDEDTNRLAEEISANLDVTCKRNQADLRLKISRNKDKVERRTSDSREADDRGTNGSSAGRKCGSNSRRHQGNERHYRNNKLYQALDASPDLDPKILGREIAYRLGETKVGLIVNVVRVLGFKCAMQILDDTRKIERRGGMLTADGSRRRTPGGVYICCLKERGYATKKEIDSIFKDEKERLKEKMKRKKQEQAARKKREFENLMKLKKQVMEYVNNKMETDVRKEDSQLSEGEIDTMSDGGEILARKSLQSGDVSIP